MIFASVCSGIEAASAAWLPLGWHCEFVAEIERVPSSVLKHHYPETPNYGDITKFKEWPDHSIDVLIGGTPCQSFSVAGLRAGLRDPRGNLALTFLAIADRYRPRWLCWENVPGVHSSWTDEAVRAPSEEESQMLRERGLDPGEYEYAEQRNDFDCFLSGMEELGYGIATTILDAQFFNLAQRRERVFVIGHIGGQWQRAAAVLFDSTCLRGDSAPRRETGQRIAPTLEARTGAGGSGWGTDFMSGGGLTAASELAPALKAEGFDGMPDGTGRGMPVITVESLIPFDTTQITSKANRSHPKPGDPSHPLAAEAHVPAVAWALQERDSKGSDSKGSDSSTKDGHIIPVAYRSSGNCGVMEQGSRTAALNTATDPTQNFVCFQPKAYTREKAGGFAGNVSPPVCSAEARSRGDAITAVATTFAVRRLTPVECERLQGFEDNYTKVTDKTADGPRYRALGNSFAVPVIRWLGERIELVDSIPC